VWWTNDGPVFVEAAKRDGRLVLTVSRGGTDLGQDEAERLFRPRAPGAGTGSKIGLFVALGIAEAQGGTAQVRVDDRLSFILDVPVAIQGVSERSDG
jgi:C4-dicarboxylate-specific signal transduction histidine kinase